MSEYSSDSDLDRHDRDERKVRWSDHQKSLHSIFGGGKVADILLWKDKKLSAAILAGTTTVWYLFEVVEYNLVTLLCHALILLMILIFVWIRSARLFNRNQPTIDDFQLSASTCRSFFIKVNSVLVSFYEISSGKDLSDFFMAICALWLMSVIGNYISTLNLLFIVVLCMETIPTLYERNQMEVNNLGAKVIEELRRFYITFDRTVLDKIPKGPVKHNKFY